MANIYKTIVSSITLLIFISSTANGRTADLGTIQNKSASDPVGEVIDCGSGWIYADTFGCIYINPDLNKVNLSWIEAQEECEEIDGYLVEVLSEKEQEFLKTELNYLQTFLGSHNYWIGATDLGKEGEWFWMTSRKPVTYTSWAGNSPNTQNGNSDDCILLDCSNENLDCLWRDDSCHENKLDPYSTSFICQKNNQAVRSTTETTPTEYPTGSWSPSESTYWTTEMPVVYVEETFTSSYPSDGPIISGTMAVVSNTLYNVQVMIMNTDLSSSSEYADIYLDDKSFGRCDGSSDGTCSWDYCPRGPHQIQTTSSSLKVELRYSQAVGSYSCMDGETGQSGTAVASVQLWPTDDPTPPPPPTWHPDGRSTTPMTSRHPFDLSKSNFYSRSRKWKRSSSTF